MDNSVLILISNRVDFAVVVQALCLHTLLQVLRLHLSEKNNSFLIFTFVKPFLQRIFIFLMEHPDEQPCYCDVRLCGKNEKRAVQIFL